MNFSSKSIFSVTLEEIPEGWDRSGGPSAPYKNYRKFREVGGGGCSKGDSLCGGDMVIFCKFHTVMELELTNVV